MLQSDNYNINKVIRLVHGRNEITLPAELLTNSFIECFNAPLFL